jgi:hypothetical protein
MHIHDVNKLSIPSSLFHSPTPVGEWKSDEDIRDATVESRSSLKLLGLVMGYYLLEFFMHARLPQKDQEVYYLAK